MENQQNTGTGEQPTIPVGIQLNLVDVEIAKTVRLKINNLIALNPTLKFVEMQFGFAVRVETPQGEIRPGNAPIQVGSLFLAGTDTEKFLVAPEPTPQN